MTKKTKTTTIRGFVRHSDSIPFVVASTVEALGDDLREVLASAPVDDRGAFELGVETQSRVHLQVRDAEGAVIHLESGGIMEAAAASRRIELRLDEYVAAHSEVDIARRAYPKYEELTPGSGLLPESSIDFEELGCVGLSPQQLELEATLTIKRTSGYGGDSCSPGSMEYVAFFIDYGQGFVPAGPPVGVRVHDLKAAASGPIHYAVRRDFVPDVRQWCSKPLVVKVRAILSWVTVPNDASFVPTWGNVVDVDVLIPPERLSAHSSQLGGVAGADATSAMLTALETEAYPKHVFVGDLEEVQEAVAESLAAVAEQASAVEPERAEAAALQAKNPNYFGSLCPSTDPAVVHEAVADLEMFAGVDVDELDLAAEVLQFSSSPTSFEELTCVGLHPDEDLLVATFVTKDAKGFDGDLCTTGSGEYVTFFIDWGKGFKLVGTDVVKVYDIPGTDRRPLHYAARVRIPEEMWAPDECGNERVVTVRAILSWKKIPAGPGFSPRWGNVLDRRVKLRSIRSTTSAKCELLKISDYPVAMIDQSGSSRGTISGRPFGGVVSCHGFVEVPGAKWYRLRCREAGGQWVTITQPRYRHVAPRKLEAEPSSDGWFEIDRYMRDSKHEQSVYGTSPPLILWGTHGLNGRYELKLEVTDDKDGNASLVQGDVVTLVLDNEKVTMHEFKDALPELPMIGVAVKDGNEQPMKCGNFKERRGDPTSTSVHVFGNFDDLHFDECVLHLAGGNIKGWEQHGPFPSNHPLLGDQGVAERHRRNGVELAKIDMAGRPSCAYLVKLTVWDRTIFGARNDGAKSMLVTYKRSSEAFVTFNWTKLPTP